MSVAVASVSLWIENKVPTEENVFLYTSVYITHQVVNSRETCLFIHLLIWKSSFCDTKFVTIHWVVHFLFYFFYSSKTLFDPQNIQTSVFNLLCSLIQPRLYFCCVLVLFSLFCLLINWTCVCGRSHQITAFCCFEAEYIKTAVSPW